MSLMSSISPTAPSRLTAPAIAEYAARVAEAHDIYDDFGKADLDSLLQKLGGTWEYEHDAESLHVRSVGDFTVFLPRFTSHRRDRFTIAHELGHYFLHYLFANRESEQSFARGGRDQAETEADMFASVLLMPEDQFSLAYNELDADVWDLAVRFEVSPAAVRVRAEVLGL